MSSVIKVSGLSKRYWIGHQENRGYHSLREDLSNLWKQPLRALTRRFRKSGDQGNLNQKDEFWALKDVSFEVSPGEVVGIVGKNGAGKSTLLKVLSRITEPTHGRVEINGRIVSLLEVGTGFHPELTGRENIYLNGAILGMSRNEVRRKFDEIVAFAEVDTFLDTPVKRYSSGMYVRLAFAVAAHLEPEILIVDEILAVGDAEFQKKCLGKMRDVSAQDGRTVLFVTHQMGTVRQLCDRAVLLTAGKVEKIGTVNEVIDTYIASQHNGERAGFRAAISARTKDIAIDEAWVANTQGTPTLHFLHTDPVFINISCRINRWVPNSELRIFIEDSRGRRVFISDLEMRNDSSLFRIKAKIPGHFLRPNTYFVTLWTFIANKTVIDNVPNVLTFIVQDGGSKYAATEGVDYGSVFSPCEWMAADERANGLELVSTLKGHSDA